MSTRSNDAKTFMSSKVAIRTSRPSGHPGRPRKRRPTDAMFTLDTQRSGQGRLVIVGKASRRRATTFVNVPISADLRKRLGDSIFGSMAMGTGALLQWALDELDRQRLLIQARPNE